MSLDPLAELARRAGVFVDWVDAAGLPKKVGALTLIRILGALGLPCETPAQIDESLDGFGGRHASKPPNLVTADVGLAFDVPGLAAGPAELILEDGRRRDVALRDLGEGRFQVPPIMEPGYHQLRMSEHEIGLAVAPRHCFALQDAWPGRRSWGIAVQLYGLRRQGDAGIGDAGIGDIGIGDIGALRDFAAGAARHGADAIALTPTHALFASDPGKYSPYAPSNRMFFNPLIADLEATFGPARILDLLQKEVGARQCAAAEAHPLIDWPAAADSKYALMRALFEGMRSGLRGDPHDALGREFLEFRENGGSRLEDHARFEAVAAEFAARGSGSATWREWPAEFRDPRSPAIEQFARTHLDAVTYHVFLQWLADRSLARAQSEMLRAGLRVGIIADLAVGMEAAGSLAWSSQQDMLVGLHIGAPPDLFNKIGQDWGLTTFSPRALARRGFEPFLATVRAALRHAGGLRIDHAMGLTRLWLIPEGASPAEGAYVAYPFTDLLRLIRLESHRHRAIVIGEDLGTVPQGFRERLKDAKVAGMDVLWFTRDDERFLPPGEWRSDAVAMTSTHDLPTVAGWWRGRDIELRQTLGLDPGDAQPGLQQERAEERASLWQAFASAGAGGEAAPRPAETSKAVDAAIQFVAATPAPLALVPLEDLLGLEEQPNVPGTIDQYPNWRRRYPLAAGEIFEDEAVKARAAMLAQRTSR